MGEVNNKIDNNNGSPTLNDNSFLIRGAKWLSNYDAEIASLLGTLGLSVTALIIKLPQGFSFFSVSSLFLFLFIALSCFGAFKSWKKKARIDELEKKETCQNREIDKLQEEKKIYSDCIKDMVKVNLTLLATNVLKLINTDRITLYKYNGQEFVIIGHYAPNPDLTHYNRHVQPLGQGVIERAWQEGEFFIDNMPDVKGKRGEKKWINFQFINFKIPKERAKEIKMKSRLIYGKNLVANPNTGPIGVLIIESLSANRFSLEDIKSSLTEIENSRLCSLVELWKEEGSERVNAFQNE